MPQEGQVLRTAVQVGCRIEEFTIIIKKTPILCVFRTPKPKFRFFRSLGTNYGLTTVCIHIEYYIWGI